MIVSFVITNTDDLNLILQLTNRLGIKQLHLDNENNVTEQKNDITEINDELNSIFGVTNSNFMV